MRVLGIATLALLFAGCPQNHPPEAVTPSGPDSGFPDSTYTFTTMASDPDGDSVRVRIAWGDDDSSAWSEWLESDFPFTTSHAWDSAGAYDVASVAEDGYRLDIAVSAPLTVTISVPPNNPPNAPSRPDGRDDVLVGATTSHRTTAVDPDKDRIAFRFAWSDGDTSEWTHWVGSGTSFACERTWTDTGSFCLRAQVRDQRGAESPWSDSLVVGVHSRFPDRVVAMFPSPCPEAIAIRADGQVAYVANFEDGTVTAYSTTDYSELAVIPVGNQPYRLALLPDGSKLYVSLRLDSIVRVIRTSDNTVVDSVWVGNTPEGVDVSPDGKRVYAALKNGSGRVAVVDATSDSLVGYAVVARQPRELCVVPPGDYLYVGCTWDGIASVVRASDLEVVATIPYGAQRGLAAHPDGRLVFSCVDDHVSVLDAANHTLLVRVELDDESSGSTDAVFLPSMDYAYVSDAGLGRVWVIRLADLKVVASVPVNGFANGLDVMPDGNRVFVPLYSVDSVAVIGF